MLLMEEGLIAIVVAGTPDLGVLGKTIYRIKTSGNRWLVHVKLSYGAWKTPWMSNDYRATWN
jgi:hypothetical protein